MVDEEISFKRAPSTPRAALSDLSNALPDLPKTVEKTTPARQSLLFDSANSILSEISGLIFSPKKETTLSALMPECMLESLEDLCVVGLEARDSPRPPEPPASAPSANAEPVPEAASCAPASPVPVPAPLAPTPAPVAAANRRASLGLATKPTQYTYHEPVYSQAEMDACLEQHQHKQQEHSQLQQQQQEQQQRLNQALELAEACELRALTAEHEASSLRAQLDHNDATVAAERAASLQDREDAAMLRVQTKALAHRLATIEAEAQATLDQERRDMAALAARLAEAEGRHSEALATLRRDLQQRSDAELAAALVRHAAETKALQEDKARLAAEAAEVPEKLAAAEARGKQYVYKKVEKQFEEGNREFVKVKRELTARLEEGQKVLWGLLAAVPGCAAAKEGERSDGEAQEVTRAVAWVAQAQQEAVALRGQVATLAEQRQNDAASHIATLEAQRAAHASELAENRLSLGTTVASLQSSLLQAEQGLADHKRRLADCQAQLASARAELLEAQGERDAQMNMCAKLCTAQARAEAALEDCRAECAAAEARCVQLRQMNEEVMGMLEAVHADRT